MPNDPGQQVGCLGRLLQLLTSGGSGGRGTSGGEPPFVVKDWLLSKAERSFLGVLDRAVSELDGPPLRVLVKVRLLDVLMFRKGSTGTTAWRNKVDRKHLDFLLVTAAELRPVLAIELDDASHRSGGGASGGSGGRAAQRDADKDAAVAAAGLPMLRVPARQSYGVEEVRRNVAEAIGAGTRAVVPRRAGSVTRE